MAKNEKAIVQVIAKENDTTAVMKEVHKASDIEENDINSFVRYRDDITHDGFYVVDDNMANIAFFMMCFSYFLTLTRVGFDEENIISLIDKSQVIS